ncbi:hypothetical protein [Candidatus Manganitrophus noduliformans]|uniref:Uncharacterized protein n=1 Tax=Candidatus Manganitrophus noduliformans TaxID=2606439 RepID=A0A7X6ICJ8_9BACT|nr:hypothetical protein [Candidatus Manganitrophus noduliformans]NKE72896.1 hypothetical protein [Candidatus Manganitrophus noduliformans]
MQKAIVCSMDEEFLRCGTEFSDRFVSSYYFVPLSITFDDSETPILPEYKKRRFPMMHLRDPLWFDRVKDIAEKHAILLPDLLKKNEITLPPIGPGPDAGLGIANRPEIRYVAKDKIKDHVKDVKDFAVLLKSRVSESDRGMVDLIERKLTELNAAVEAAPEMYSTPTESVSMAISAAVAGTMTPSAGSNQAQQLDFFLNAIKSDVGYVFFDRTRIRPKGFTVGEHVYTLSLAPGEEVVLEQKTFSKRSTTFEEQTEQEKQFDLELSSTLTNEIQEGFERQTSLTDARGFQVGGSVGAQVEVVKIDANASHSRNITEADSQTKSRSIKQSQTASSKTASKYRTQHKVTFKLSTEEGFESTAKRVIRNPNKYTAVDLHYFKILRVLEVSQERYGVRLCWAPYIQDPAFDFIKRIRDGRSKIIQDSQNNIQLPPEPTQPAGRTVPNLTEFGSVHVDKWDWWDGSTPDSPADRSYKIRIDVPTNYKWNSDINTVKNSIRLDTAMQRTAFAEPDGDPYLSGNEVIIPVKVTVSSRPLWAYLSLNLMAVALAFVNPPAGAVAVAAMWAAHLVSNQVAEQDKKAMNEFSPVYVQAQVRFEPDPATHPDLQAYKADLDEWKIEHDKWKGDKDTLLKDAHEKGVEAANDWEQETLKQHNPIAEMMNIIINKYFTPSVRDEGWEIDMWQKLFDWDAASYVLYPSWWSGPTLRDSTKEPADFFNASWARLYLPIKMGKIGGTSVERIALRWIFDKVTNGNLIDPNKEKTFTNIETELANYRKSYFGDDQETNIVSSTGEECPELKEKYTCLAHWTELMPTDGTHIEVIQSMTSAADQFSKNEVDDANALRNAMIESERQDVELKKKALTQVTQPANVEVRINTDKED